ncbi:response regulator [Runella sp. CRIBMP]|uniref:response regulator n=1 Tax=Runella sp. CRIBMP TaxID=2683261 RepID=UPI001412C448|nr:response regulator [Runella sp. CRIBMP]NBB22553.1 response regulator [Runella sp. CRIBMP]
MKSILIIDDESIQANSLAKSLKKERTNIDFFVASKEEEILYSIEHLYFDIAIVDLRMDDFDIDGFQVIDKIIEINPFAKIIVVSAFTQEYFTELNKILLSGKIIAIIEKKEYNVFLSEIVLAIAKYEEYVTKNPSETSKALLNYYANAKNQQNSYEKGIVFEHFITLLFNNMGFKTIIKRVIDKSRNEVDLIIRNDVNDNFFSKFRPYILVECKNKPDDGIGKNDFIQFYSKLQHTNGLSDLGFLITSGFISKTTYLEAMRTSKNGEKIAFISNPEIERLINSESPMEELKKIIDEQVKDN